MSDRHRPTCTAQNWSKAAHVWPEQPKVSHDRALIRRSRSQQVSSLTVVGRSYRSLAETIPSLAHPSSNLVETGSRLAEQTIHWGQHDLDVSRELGVGRHMPTFGGMRPNSAGTCPTLAEDNLNLVERSPIFVEIRNLHVSCSPILQQVTIACASPPKPATAIIVPSFLFFGLLLRPRPLLFLTKQAFPAWRKSVQQDPRTRSRTYAFGWIPLRSDKHKADGSERFSLRCWTLETTSNTGQQIAPKATLR